TLPRRRARATLRLAFAGYSVGTAATPASVVARKPRARRRIVVCRIGPTDATGRRVGVLAESSGRPSELTAPETLKVAINEIAASAKRGLLEGVEYRLNRGNNSELRVRASN